MENNLDMICGLIIHMRNDITNLVLQKLLYFIQAHSLLTNHIEAFNNRMEAWMYGPVVPEVYDNFKRDSNYYRNINFQNLNPDIRNSVEVVVNNLADLNPYYLVDKTHEYEPWINAWNNGLGSGEITPNAIREYHTRRLAEGSAF
ncbi:DUF4065 domain-containing protein [Fusobacterium nucleatum]|uniref:Panacea domain-containing protein n=1 Tax=Fusobacterium TaxID=848 RepID=UPI00206C2BE4|nr:MAG TPA: hypothetical protein [Caudoviricetes sp.]